MFLIWPLTNFVMPKSNPAAEIFSQNVIISNISAQFIKGNNCIDCDIIDVITLTFQALTSVLTKLEIFFLIHHFLIKSKC